MLLNRRHETAPPSAEALAAFDRSWSRRVLDNGMSAIHVPAPHSEEFCLGTVVGAGSRFEPDELSGISHFLEHMMFRGSERYPRYTDLAEAFEWLGGDWNAATGREDTEYWYRGIRHTAERAIGLFAEFLENPRFNDLEVERSIILREIEGETNEFGHSTDLDLHTAALIWPDSALARPILGKGESLDRVDHDALRAHRDRLYVPRNMVLWAVGGGESRGVLDAVSRAFNDHRDRVKDVAPPARSVPTPFRGPAVRWVEDGDNEYSVQLSFLAEGEWSDAAPAYDLIARILADGFCSRLSSRLREELGLVYEVDAHTMLHPDTGTVGITAAVKAEQFEPFFGELFAMLRGLASEGPREDEVARVVLRKLVDLELCRIDPERIGPRLAWPLLCGRDPSLALERARIERLGPARVRETCAALFRPERAALVVIGPAADRIEDRLARLLAEGL